MRRPILLALLALLAVLALPAAAPAATAKISPSASAVSAAGVTSVEAANPNRYALRGKAIVTVRGRTVASRTVRLARRSVTEVRLRLNAKALKALRAAGGRATITLRLRRPGGRTTTARRTLTLRSAAATPQAPATGAPAGQPATGPSTGAAPNGTASPAPSSNRWAGRMGTEGPYDDLELTVADGQLSITKAPTVPVSCFENGGSYRSSLSFELFDAPGPWAVGSDGSVAKQGLAVNQLVSGGARTITYKVTGTSQDAGRLAGTLGMSFSDSKYDIFTNTITFINCAGSQSFEAVPAG
jgi:hypothetical protein